MKTLATTAAILVATAISASAMTSHAIIKGEVEALGYSAEVTENLSDAQIEKLSSALYSGSHSDVRAAVNSIIRG